MAIITGQQNGTDKSTLRRDSIATVRPTDAISNAALVIAPPLNDVLVDTVNDVTYVGTATMGAGTSDEVWQIQKVDSSVNPIKVGYAFTTIDESKQHKGFFIYAWDDRASLEYTR